MPRIDVILSKLFTTSRGMMKGLSTYNKKMTSDRRWLDGQSPPFPLVMNCDLTSSPWHELLHAQAHHSSFYRSTHILREMIILTLEHVQRLLMLAFDFIFGSYRIRSSTF